MRYAYEDLSYSQFEQLVILLCQRLFGLGVQGFATGPDGGRDAKFVGTAELHPSKASPWVGTTIIQAKHTLDLNCTFMDSDFYSEEGQSATLVQELTRIKALRDGQHLDHFILFANRRLAGSAEALIIQRISDHCGIPRGSLYLCGVEQLELWLKTFPDIATLASLDPIDGPLIVTPDDLSEVVSALAAQSAIIRDVIDDPPTPRVPYELKNASNNMTDIYARTLRRKYLKDTAQVHSFLAAPENDGLLRLYESVVDEIEMKIVANRHDFQTFDKVMEYLVDLLFGRDPILRRHKRLTRIMLFYMYWNCDIGQVDHAPSN